MSYLLTRLFSSQTHTPDTVTVFSLTVKGPYRNANQLDLKRIGQFETVRLIRLHL